MKESMLRRRATSMTTRIRSRASDREAQTDPTAPDESAVNGRHLNNLDAEFTGKRLALLVNTVAPYRVPMYEELSRSFETTILFAGHEANRHGWALPPSGRALSFKKSWGVTIRPPMWNQTHIIDYRNIHLTPGYALDLVRIRPHAIVTNEMGLRTILALAYGSLFRVPVWVWWGGTHHTESTIGLARRLTRRVIARWGRHWISYGRTSTDYLLTLGVPNDRIHEAQNQVDNRMFRRARPRLQRTGHPVILCVGQLIGRKGIDLLLKAAASLRAQGESFSLLIVGSGAERAQLEALARDLALDNVTFLGAVAPASMPAVYASADCLVFPTLSDVWGLVVNEALWAGLPVLCSRYAGCAEELLPCENIFDPNDESSFVEGLRSAVRGQIAPPDPRRLRPIQDVGRRIADGVRNVVALDDEVGTPGGSTN